MLVVGLAWSSGVLGGVTVVGLWDSIIPKDTEAFFLFFFLFIETLPIKPVFSYNYLLVGTHTCYFGVLSVGHQGAGPVADGRSSPVLSLPSPRIWTPSTNPALSRSPATTWRRVKPNNLAFPLRGQTLGAYYVTPWLRRKLKY